MMFQRGAIVEFRTRKNGTVTGVVFKVRTISKGRRAGKLEYKVAPFGESGSYIVPGFLVKPSKREVSEAEIQDVLDEVDRIIERRANRKRYIDGERRAVLEDLGLINIGDEVLIRGRNGPNWEATVIKLNYKSGKIAIAAPGYKSGQRWISAASIKEVVRPLGDCPIKLTQMVLDDLQDRGVAQARRGQESSGQLCVVAFTKELASGRRHKDEIVDGVVIYDPKYKLFWRDIVV